ncbi:MAG TPA: hypothetical protein PJ988_13745, partial [Anaerolinea sp.]|nr:hypothetical protein [Anaerolinea sp.]
DAPETQQAAEPTPQVIEGGGFNPLATGQPLPMDAYQYTGRALQPGDLLAVSVGTDASTLYASSGGGSAEVVAALPGQVLAVYPHPDRGGIDYITGALDPDRGNRYEQLYTLRFDQGAPRLLVGGFERQAYGFAWSADGRWLAYLAPRSGPGESGARAVHLVDLTCRQGGECAGQTVPAEANLDLHDLAWSPVEQRLLALGVPQTQSYGASDVYTIYIDPQDGKVYLTNLTESPTIDDQSAQWAEDGKSVLIACSTADIDPNYYGLCKNDLQRGMDTLLPVKMPTNMRLFLASPDGKRLADRVPVYADGVLKLRAVDLPGGETRTLVEWPAAKGGFFEPAISPDGQSLGVVEPGALSALWLSLSGDQSLTILQTQDPLTWIGWVP